MKVELVDEKPVVWLGKPGTVYTYRTKKGLLKKRTAIYATSIGGTFFFYLIEMRGDELPSDALRNVVKLIP
jgi:hypothetical protein